MNEYTVFLNGTTENSCDITISADSFEISKDEQYIYFKHGMQTVGFFKMSEVIGIAKES